MKPARYVVTYAQDATPVDREFFSALETYAAHRKAELIVVAGLYRNPTSRYDEQFPDGEWDPRTHPYLLDERRVLCPNLTLFADVRTQPTATRPLTGFEVFAAGHSGIFGHPKRALETVPTATRMPRLLVTTSACTVPNYSTTKAGRKGDAHHVLGALVVEVDAKGIYFLRHVSWDARTRSFTDLNRRYSATKHEAAPPAASIAYGDIHVGRGASGTPAARGARRLYDLVQPRHTVLHDVLDFSARNHHSKTFRARYAGVGRSVANEVADACRWVRDHAAWGTHEVHVVRSNHDEACERWVDEYSPKEDPENAHYWHFLSEYQLRVFRETRQYPNLFAAEYERHYPDEPVHFLKRNEPLVIGGVNNGFHGDKGLNGSRGSRAGYVKMAVKVNRGHGHTPGIQDGVFDLGVFGDLDHDYNGLPSTWLNAHCVTHADGKRQLLIFVDGRFTT